MIHLDTSVLVDALTGPRRSANALRGVLDRGERIGIATLVLYEWLRGPRRDVELVHQEALLPATAALPFGPREATLAAELYRVVPRARQREFDLGVAACALACGATLWTLNADDFRDIPGLGLFEAQARSPDPGATFAPEDADPRARRDRVRSGPASPRRRGSG